MEQTRIEMQAWYYHELIRQADEIIERWLNESCAPEDLQNFATGFPQWVNGTVLTGRWPESCGRRLEKEIRYVGTQLEHFAKVDTLMATNPELGKLKRRDALAIADTSHMPSGEALITERFQLAQEKPLPLTVAWYEPS